MGSFSIWHWAIVAVIVLLLFGGRGKLSGLMGDAAKGVRAFRDGLKDTDEEMPRDDAPQRACRTRDHHSRRAHAVLPIHWNREVYRAGRAPGIRGGVHYGAGAPTRAYGCTP